MLALTDHDAVPEQRYMDEDGNLVDLLELAETSGVKLLLGTEISCETDVEDVHIVCLGCRWEDAWFAELERELSRSRSEGYQLLPGTSPGGWDAYYLGGSSRQRRASGE